MSQPDKPVDSAEVDSAEVDSAEESRLEHDLEGNMVFYAVYFNPADFPGMWVVRRWFINGLVLGAEPQLWAKGETLEAVRRSKPRWTVIIPRQDADDPAIQETWI